MRTNRQLKDHIRALESAGYALRSEAMLRSTPRADAAIARFDELVSDNTRKCVEEIKEQEQKRASRRGALPQEPET